MHQLCGVPSFFFQSPNRRKLGDGKWGKWIPTQKPLGWFLHFYGWVASISHNIRAHSTRLTSGVGASWKQCICVARSLATCDHLLKAISVLGHQILLSSQKISSPLCSATFFQKNSSACSFCLLGGQWEVPWTSYHLLSACFKEKKDASA